jgi:hypothetical protein
MRRLSRLLLGVVVSVTLLASSAPARALEASGFTYTVVGGAATVTGCASSCSATLVIPATLGGADVTRIDSGAFSNSQITSVTIPDSVTNIGDYAFWLNQLTSVTIPDSVTSIGSEAFDSNDLTTVTIGSSVTSIGAYAFYGNDLISVTIPTSVTSIGAQAFSYNSLITVTIPYWVGSIGDWAFSDNSLTSVIFLGAAPAAGYGVFYGNDGLTAIKRPTASSGWGATWSDVPVVIASGFTYDVASGAATVTGCIGPCPTTLDIPAALDGYSVTTIGDFAFDNEALGLDGLVGVTIPNSVTSIGESAFENNSLTTVTIPNAATNIGDYAFYSNSLTTVTIPNSVTSIGNDAFRRNSLTSVTIGNSVTTIGAGAFGQNALTSVIIPNSVTTIGGSAFYNNALASATIGDSVTSIGYSAFFNNDLTSVIIPNSVTSIDDSAFQNNDLTSVTISNSVTSIGSYAFNRNLLTNLIVPSSVQSIGREAFSSNALTSVLFAGNAPASSTAVFADNTGLWSVLRYASATGWASTWSSKTVVTIKQSFSEPFVARVNGSAAGATVTYAGPSTTVTLDTIGQTGAGVISFSESDPDCSISGRTLRILQVGDGSCTVTATIGESTTHYGASDTVTVTISKVAASLAFSQPSNVSYGVAPFSLAATTSNTDSATVTFTVAAASQSVCSVRGRTVTVKATGRCTITASRAATANYLAATSVVQSFTVMKSATATTRPTISGTARVGRKLTASKGTWTGYPTPTFTYQWYTCTAAISSPRTSIPRTCTPISSATGSTFTVLSAQKGKYIAVLVTGTSAGTRSTSWLSKTTTKVP